MGLAKTIRKIMVRETLLALLVLALGFLNFGHSNVAFAADGHLVVTGSSYCGNPLNPADGDHTPCHACRIGNAADLPTAPLEIAPVIFVVTAVSYDVPPTQSTLLTFRLAASPRAPPAA